MPFLKRTGKALAIFACLVVVLILTHTIWFRWLGSFLVQAGPPVKADAVLVLAGDWNGDRILKAAEVVTQGYAPIVLVSGPMNLYGVNEATLAINYAVAHGYRRDIFEPMLSGAFSTRDEAGVIGPELARRGVHRLMIVTSDFHTRRSGRIFRKAVGSGVDLHMVASADRHFSPGAWWKDREGQKVLFFEWSKTIAEFLGK